MSKKVKRNSDEIDESPFGDEANQDLKDSDIFQLLNSQGKFTEFVSTLGKNSEVPLSEGNIRYSKQVSPGVILADDISRLVQMRVQKMMKNRRIKRNWGKEDCTILAWVLQKLTNGRHIKCPEKLKFCYWKAAAEVIPGSTPEQCMFKWLSMKKIKLQNFRWQESESRLLQKLVAEYGTEKWKEVSRKLYLLNTSEERKYRHPKQCRQQWNCYLNPVLKKGPWQPEEDEILLNLVLKEHGRRKWSDFSKSIPGRTENALKNRYSFLLQGEKQKYPSLSELQIIKRLCFEIKQKKQIEQMHPIIPLEEDKSSEHKSPKKVEEHTPPTNRFLENEDASIILSGDFSAFRKPVFSKIEEPQEAEKREVRMIEPPILRLDGHEKMKVQECSIDEIMKFMQKNREILIPARLGKNKQVVALFPEITYKNDV